MEKLVLLRGRAALSIPREIDVRALRERLGMTQNLFAARFGFPLATLRHWEYRRRKPTGASLTLLNVIAHNPRAVMRALKAPLGAGLRPLVEYTALADAIAAREDLERQAALNADYEVDAEEAEEALKREFRKKSSSGYKR